MLSPKGGSGYAMVQSGCGCGWVVVVEIGTGSGEMGVGIGESGGSDVGVVVSICWFCANACAVSCDLGRAWTRVGCGVIALQKESVE